MPTQQAFEGDTLEAVLARVKDEVGPGARITQAEKVRTGGFAGFFSRERFEVTVEIDDAAPSASGVRLEEDDVQSAPPKSLLDLVEEVSARERGVSLPADDPSTTADHRLPAGGLGPTVETVPSTSGKSFHDVLQGIAAEAGLITPTPVRQDVEPLPVTEPDPGAEQNPTGEQDPVAEQGPMGEQGPVADVRPAVDEDPLRYAPLQDIKGLLDADKTAERFPVTSETLTALGIPPWLLGPGAGRTTAAQRVLTAMEQMPPAAPLVARRGDVVVVVGDERTAMEAASVAAAQFGQTSDDVVVAGMEREGFNTISCVDDAETRASLWRRCGVPFVVAICVASNPESTQWAQRMIEALDPVTVWAAVRADRKPDDVAAWAGRLGRVDALAVGACAETVSPAAVLGAGIPVAVVEGRRSSAAAWTALLTDRLEA